MKKQLLILAVAATALAACTNDETVEVNKSDAISFRPLINNVTRGAAKTAFVENDVIDVWAVYNSTKLFQDDYTRDDGTNGFTSTNSHYWPSDVATKNVTFNVVWGATTNTGVRNTQTAAGIVAHSPHTTASSQTDMLFAQHTSATKESPVGLNFRHALSQIVVNAKNTNPNLKVTITGVRVGYVGQAGTFTYSGSSTDKREKDEDGTVGTISEYESTPITLIAQGNWSVTEMTGSTIAKDYKYDQTSLTATELIGNASDVAHTIEGFSNWMLLPQALTNADTDTDGAPNYVTPKTGTRATPDPDFAGSYLALYMKIENYNGSSAAGTIVDYQWCYWPISTSWQPGYKYTYTIDVAGGGYEPEDTDNDGEGDPVLDGAVIVFSPSCTIDAWVVAAASNVTMP